MGNGNINRDFMRGEKLLWSGRPAQGFFLTSRDRLLIPFSLLWGGFANVLAFAAVIGDGPVSTKLWLSLFALMGLYIIAGRFFVDAAARARTEYMVTDRRVIIRRSRFFRNLYTSGHELLPSISLEEGTRGRGTIKFGVRSNRRMSGWTPALANEPQLLGIDNAQHVYSILQKARSDCRRSQ
ncbi:PH domain-containing protein [Rhizobium leguminosarum]|uniref:PH domain-containing protein n=1 Tax=Rhizobium leguminosarum TaxID=384 RepID=UPI001C93EC5B|nr:PH domain-containing protein [Rhizobium leguminosarum]MBY5366822.1 PH domain-containing protein [Rhizobium leguminosarum]MBY5448534.1 PH domain-containing protein [Rhizobium leguminosarum]